MDRLTIEDDLARAHRQDARDRLQGGRLADPIASHQGDDFAGADLEIDAAKRARVIISDRTGTVVAMAREGGGSIFRITVPTTPETA
jgi:hypothetical protein